MIRPPHYFCSLGGGGEGLCARRYDQFGLSCYSIAPAPFRSADLFGEQRRESRQ